MRNKNYIYLILGAVVCLFLAGCGPDIDEVREEGESVYIANCARCHQIDGIGFAHVHPNLAGNPIVTLRDSDPVIEVVLEGRGSMPPFRESLDAQQLASVITYIRTSWGNNAPIVTPSQVR
jgi:mono/diheme cytochrome c family protein